MSLIICRYDLLLVMLLAGKSFTNFIRIKACVGKKPREKGEPPSANIYTDL